MNLTIGSESESELESFLRLHLQKDETVGDEDVHLENDCSESLDCKKPIRWIVIKYIRNGIM